MKILIYGLGYVGLTAAGCLTKEGHQPEGLPRQNPGYACGRLLKASRHAGARAPGFTRTAAGA